MSFVSNRKHFSYDAPLSKKVFALIDNKLCILINLKLNIHKILNLKLNKM